MDEDAKRRAQARASWPGRKYRLGEEPTEDLSASTTAVERLAMTWEFSVRCWLLAGRELPTYRRDEMPGRVIRPPKAPSK